MNFTFRPSSSFLIHSSSGMPEAPLASLSQRAYLIGFWGSCLLEKEAPYSDYLTTPRNENCGEDVDRTRLLILNHLQQHLQKIWGNTRRSKQELEVTGHEASCQQHALVSR